ncbi:interferon regulatory factor 5-like isoform X3 [Carcharodon carcharias]|uniref:interferon regulatory factor 5-like isoform X3 n=1 Tax=Carcharodon carcharias TaxID=13397 RepID=UPI001B7F619F|nr:interferon regulatory factor 5-like isoform X3 [Carcharodon carcharias]
MLLPVHCWAAKPVEFFHFTHLSPLSLLFFEKEALGILEKKETQRQNNYFASRSRIPGTGETFSGNWYNLRRMGSQKPLLCDWLIKQINSRLYPGLYWINAEKTQFRIPWKHGSRQDISAEDTKIFEAWAIASGRYKPGIDSADPSIWKRNFRSALNRKRQFHRVVDNRNDSENPHLIYEIRSVGQEAAAEEESEDISPAVDNTSPAFSASSSPNLDFPLPETAATLVSDQQQIKYTTKLLERMDQGLIVEVQNTRICAQRLGRCKGFWSMTEYPTSSEPQQISNKEFTVLYDLQQFLRETEAFLQAVAGSPNYSIWLCLGELWPDPDFKPWSKKMIMVQVTPIIFKLLHELAHGVGASSLQSESVNLQLSDPLSSSSFLSILEQYMDVE